MSNWASLPIAFRPAIPSNDYLEKQLGDGDEAVSGAVTTALAAALYRLKSGSSVAISFPVFGPDILKAVLNYMHRCRIDAMHGQIRANWLNSYAMCMAPDLLVWSRASMQARLLRGQPGINLKHVGLNRETRGLKHHLDDDERIARTILCQAGEEIRTFCMELRTVVHPFAIIIDMTPYGYREKPEHLADLMEEHFSGVPMLFLSSTGDLETDKAFCQLPKRFSFWRQHLLDMTPVSGKKSRLTWSPRLVTVPDQRISDRLLNAVGLCKKLHEATPVTMRKDTSVVLYRVFNALQSLSVPIEFYESQLSTRRHGGLFPVKPLKDWLPMARRIKMPTGETQNLLSESVYALEGIISFIEKGITGKAQALARWIQESVRKNQSALVVVGTALDASIMRSWLVNQHASLLDEGKLSVLGTRSVRDVYELKSRFDCVMVTGKLWDNDLWSIFAGKDVCWLTYPCESHWLERMASRAMFAGAACEDSKADWWWLKPQDSKPVLAIGTAMPTDIWTDCMGQYLIEKTFEAVLPDDPEWMAKLFEGIEEPEEIVRPNSPLSPGEVSVTTDCGFYRFHCNSIVQVFTEKGSDPKVEDVAARDLEEGMRLILLNGEDRGLFSVMEMLIDFVTENSMEEQMYQRAANRWFDFVDGALWKSGCVENMQRKLKEEGVDIGLATIRRWTNHVGIAPQYKDSVLPAVARLSGIKFTPKDLALVQKSQSKVLGLHNRVGRALKAAMLAEIEGNTRVTIFGKNSIPLEVLRAQYNIEEVQHVNVCEEGELAEQSASDISSLLKEMAEASNGRLAVTSRALRSAEDSPYRDLGKIKQCLTLLIEDYHRVWTEGAPINPAIKKGLLYGIEFKGDSSIKTKGLYKNIYYPLYQGKKTDIGRHFSIGDSRDPERCFRIHIHFDEVKKSIVIHHAGRHLPTAKG